MLAFESEKGQQFAAILPDELTIAHMWKDERKPREYTFDTVRGCALRAVLLWACVHNSWTWRELSAR
jgi:hypothetical protein